MRQERHLELAHAEDEASQEWSEQQRLASDVSQSGEAPSDLLVLGLRLIVELSDCVQRVSRDLTEAHTANDLKAARQRWAQHLRALAALVEGERANPLPSEMPLSAL